MALYQFLLLVLVRRFLSHEVRDTVQLSRCEVTINLKHTHKFKIYPYFKYESCQTLGILDPGATLGAVGLMDMVVRAIAVLNATRNQDTARETSLVVDVVGARER